MPIKLYSRLARLDTELVEFGHLTSCMTATTASYFIEIEEAQSCVSFYAV